MSDGTIYFRKIGIWVGFLKNIKLKLTLTRESEVQIIQVYIKYIIMNKRHYDTCLVKRYGSAYLHKSINIQRIYEYKVALVMSV